MGVGGFIGGSQRCDESRGRCAADREGCEAVAFGLPMVYGGGEREPAWVIFSVDDVFGGRPVGGGWREEQSVDSITGRRPFSDDGERGERGGLVDGT